MKDADYAVLATWDIGPETLRNDGKEVKFPDEKVHELQRHRPASD